MSPKPKERSRWSHLPNARHIDAILLHVRKHPEKWIAARNAAWGAAWVAARNATRNAAWDARVATRGAATVAAKDTAEGVARAAAWGACLALIAWDDAGELLNADMDLMKFLVEVQDPRAVLLMPARIAMQGGAR